MNGRELKDIREALGWSQARLAAELGVAANTVARWERDERSISAPVAALIRMIAAQKNISKPA